MKTKARFWVNSSWVTALAVFPLIWVSPILSFICLLYTILGVFIQLDVEDQWFDKLIEDCDSTKEQWKEYDEFYGE